MRFLLTDFVAGTNGANWQPPAGSLGAIVLTPEKFTGTPIALCGFADSKVAKGGEIDFGTGLTLSDCKLDGIQKSGWAARLKTSLSSRPDLAGLLHDTLTIHADPTGANNARPMPLVGNGTAPYYMGGLVASFPLTLGDPAAVALMKQCQAEIYQQVLAGKLPPGLHRKWTSTKLDMLGLTAADVNLISSNLVPPSERIPLKPSTVVSDDFSSGNFNNFTTIGGSFSVTSNQVVVSTFNECHAYFNTALSGTDHYAQFDYITRVGNANWIGPRVRMTTSGDGFGAWAENEVNNNPWTRLYTGTTPDTVLAQGSDPFESAGVPATFKLDIVGSTIRTYRNGTLKTTVTNTSYPSNLRVGITGSASSSVTGDNFYATDGILPAPTVTSVAASSGSTAGGTNVTITGTGFVATPTVTFGGTSATNVVWVNSTTLTCTTPAHAAGAVNVVVTNPDTQTGTGTNVFTYLAASAGAPRKLAISIGPRL